MLAMVTIAWASPAFGQIQTVILRGDSAPTAGAVFRKFRVPYLSDASGERIAFRATSKGAGGAIKGLYRLDATGAGTVIIQKDEFFLSQRFRNFKRPAINSSADIAWFAFLSGGKRGVFRTVGATSPVPITMTFQPTPLGGFFTDLGPPEITDSGAVIFWGETSVAGMEEGLFRCQGGDGDCFSSGGTGTMDALVTSGTAVPDRSGRSFCTFEDGLHQSSYGIAFRSDTKLNCLNSSEVALPGVFRMDLSGSAGIETVALEGESTQLISGQTAVYDRFRDRPSIRDDGTVVFRADTAGNFETEAIFRCDPASCPAAAAEILYAKGDLDAGMNELRRFSRPQIADNGDIAFQAKPRGLTAGGPTIYLRRSSGVLDTVATKGDPVPGSSPATLFRRLGLHNLSASGSLAFRAKVKGNTVPTNTGIFLVP